jgi:hypothetical protein
MRRSPGSFLELEIVGLLFNWPALKVPAASWFNQAPASQTTSAMRDAGERTLMLFLKVERDRRSLLRA